MVMLSVRKAWFACAMTLPACSGAIGDVEPGTLALQLKPAAAVKLSLLKYTVSHERGYVRSGPVAIGEQQTFTFNVDTLPPALGYVVSAYAEGVITKLNTKTVCTGQASFEIRTAQSTAVSMTLQCDGVMRTGTGTGNSLNNCPIVGVISAAPAQAPVGQDVQLRAEVPADNDGPLPVEYQWRADSGLLSAPRAKQTRFLCNKPGVVEVELAVSDGDQACDEPPATVSVTCTDDDCINLTHCTNSPAQSTAPSKAAAGHPGSLAGQGGSGSTTNTTSITHAAPPQTAGTGGASASTNTTTKVVKDAGTPTTIDAALPWDAGSWGDWPEPDDNTPPREQRRRERTAAGSGGQPQAGVGGASGAGGAATELEAGSGGAGTSADPQPDAGTGDGDDVDAGLIDGNDAMNAAPGTRAGAYSENVRSR